jgi:hypothetical protein
MSSPFAPTGSMADLARGNHETGRAMTAGVDRMRLAAWAAPRARRPGIGSQGVGAVVAAAILPCAAAVDCESVLTFADGNVPQREVFVATNGDDSSGDGSPTRPFRTLAQAVRQAGPGTAVRLRPGTYAGGNYVEGLRGRAEAPVWIGGLPGETRPVIAGGLEALHLTNVRYLVVEYLDIAGASANGINCDDGGDYANAEACRFVVFRNLSFRDIGSGGNQDALKLSGVNDYWVLNSDFRRGSAGGSGIDHVGCHRGRVIGCRFESMGSNSIQCKGGSEDIEVRGCQFLSGGQRAINIGGSTGFQFFRPPLTPTGPNAEARNIRVIANLFRGSDAPVAFVGSVDSLVANNTIVDPTRWVVRILQETVTGGGYTFLACGDSRFVNNLVYFSRAQLSTFVNVGPNTDAGAFAFANNLWYAHDNPAQSAPSLPVTETAGLRGLDPRLADPTGGDLHLQPGSPAIGKGTPMAGVTVDLDRRCYGTPPTLGAFEPREVPTPRSDADAMPDWWEAFYALDPRDAGDAGADPDGDGATNEHEFLAGTDPRDPQSALRITGWNRDESGFWLRFPALRNRVYAVERADLTDGMRWTEARALGRGSDRLTGTTVAGAPGATPAWFRVRAAPP